MSLVVCCIGYHMIFTHYTLAVDLVPLDSSNSYLNTTPYTFLPSPHPGKQKVSEIAISYASILAACQRAAFSFCQPELSTSVLTTAQAS
jgi:hypothetical protein